MIEVHLLLASQSEATPQSGARFEVSRAGQKEEVAGWDKNSPASGLEAGA